MKTADYDTLIRTAAGARAAVRAADRAHSCSGGLRDAEKRAAAELRSAAVGDAVREYGIQKEQAEKLYAAACRKWGDAGYGAVILCFAEYAEVFGEAVR